MFKSFEICYKVLTKVLVRQIVVTNPKFLTLRMFQIPETEICMFLSSPTLHFVFITIYIPPAAKNELVVREPASGTVM